jgi:hypothetical protein
MILEDAIPAATVKQERDSVDYIALVKSILKFKCCPKSFPVNKVRTVSSSTVGEKTRAGYSCDWDVV